MRALAWLLLILLIAWGTLALWLDASGQTWFARLFAMAFLAGCTTMLVALRPLWRAMLAVAAIGMLDFLWWYWIPPRNDRDWAPEVARLPYSTIAGNQLTIQNVRNFDYRGETYFTERWEKRTYNLNQLRGVDLFLSYWGSPLIAHTIVSWVFTDGTALAISIETRKEKGETYSALRGFFRQYELYYVVADERDVVRLRTNYRGERVYLYHIRMSPEGARAVLLDYLQAVNGLVERPRWYNALTHNCTTTIRHHALHVGEGHPWDWRILVNGHVDELSYERGMIDTSRPFPEVKTRSDITKEARASDDSADFSTRIRQGLPSGIGPQLPSRR